jgi:hypothetical protein
MLNPFPNEEVVAMMPVEDQMIPVDAVIDAIDQTVERLAGATAPLRGLSHETEAAALRYGAKHGKGARKAAKKAPKKRTPKKPKTAWDHIANGSDDETTS